MKKYTLKRISGQTGSISQQLDEARFTINYKNLLNPAQFEAASALEGPYLIIAGAGTGKTRTLVYRLARLIESGYDPKSILLLTFTRKAAREMLNRATQLLDHRCSHVNGGTFHSFANLLMRKYAGAMGIQSNFTILDQGDSEDVINLLRTQAGVVSKDKRFPNKSTIFRILSLSLNTYKSVDQIIIEEFPHFINELDKIITIGEKYIEYKRKNNLFDYDDLLIFARDFLLSGSPASISFLNTINFVMIDEYQDTNKLQAELVRGLTSLKKNIMVVGDDAQSIYSFRGANFQNIMEFPDQYPGTKVILLEENYRSTQNILNFANRIYEGASEKFDKELFTSRTGGSSPLIVAAINDKMQSHFIVDQILELREQGMPLTDIAVLFRSSFFSFDLELELTKANIPYVKFGGMKFVETAHIKDVLAFLRISVNPTDYVSWYRILLLHEGVGPRSAEKIIAELNSGTMSIEREPERQQMRHGDTIYNLMLMFFKLIRTQETPEQKVDHILQYYYPLFKAKYDDYNKRLKDLEFLTNMASQYQSPESFLSDLAIEPPVDSVTDMGDEDKNDEYLTLSTIHSAKGLEWNAVFVIHVLDGHFPSSRNGEKLEALDEERRLMYVAVTRAKNNLYLTYPMNIYDRESGTTLSKPSRFLDAITPDLAEGYLIDGTALLE
ncbi:MAG: ATP-dependent helicase [Ignavibacteriaceae bacterium]|nr:ATP-dependent helicase [Ignavibacteriaceae bacterium]